jgi:NAD(P)-dependent dehydrogenase (short-subunit alcohol dehydrogenase family)
VAGRVNGKVIIVTGAASGIGRATATLLAQEGATVVLTDVTADAGRALARELGGPHVFIQHDVSDERQWQDVIGETQKLFGKLNGAGAGQQHRDRDAGDLAQDQFGQSRRRFPGLQACDPGHP